MSDRQIDIRAATENDFPAIIALNRAQVEHTSAMDLARLRLLHGYASYHRVVLVDGQFAGFLLGMREGAAYDNDNYRWFADRFERFAYVDRIVVADGFWGLGLGKRLYRDLITQARAWGSARITCEYNVEPPNLASAAFHDSFGFRELDQQHLLGGSKRVSLQVLDLASA